MLKVTSSNAPAVLVGASSVVSFTLGALAAHVLTKNVLKAKYEALVEEEVQTAKAYFSMRHKTGAYDDPGKIVAAKKAERVSHSNDVEEYVEKVEVYKPDVPDISKSAKKKTSKPEPEEDMEAFEKRLIREAKEEVDTVKRRLDVFDDDDDDDILEVGDEDGDEIVTMNVFHPGNQGDRGSNKPFVLTVREFEEGEFDYVQNTLTYYEGDDVLADERDQPIHHMQKIVGTENLKFGDKSGDPNIVYIRNNELEVDFEICRSKGTFTEEVLGYAEPSNKPRPRKFRESD